MIQQRQTFLLFPLTVVVSDWTKRKMKLDELPLMLHLAEAPDVQGKKLIKWWRIFFVHCYWTLTGFINFLPETKAETHTTYLVSVFVCLGSRYYSGLLLNKSQSGLKSGRWWSLTNFLASCSIITSMKWRLMNLRCSWSFEEEMLLLKWTSSPMGSLKLISLDCFPNVWNKITASCDFLFKVMWNRVCCDHFHFALHFFHIASIGTFAWTKSSVCGRSPAVNTCVNTLTLLWLARMLVSLACSH